MSFHRDCVCGHMWAVHDHYRAGTDCSIGGCGCRRYRPRPWWRRPTTHERPPSGESATQATPGLPRPPGAGHIIPMPPATHHCGGVKALIDIRANGCIWVWRRGEGWQHTSDCGHDTWFSVAEWNQRYTQ